MEKKMCSGFTMTAKEFYSKKKRLIKTKELIK